MMHIVFLTISYLAGYMGADVPVWSAQFNILFAIWVLNTIAYCNYTSRNIR